MGVARTNSINGIPALVQMERNAPPGSSWRAWDFVLQIATVENLNRCSLSFANPPRANVCLYAGAQILATGHWQRNEGASQTNINVGDWTTPQGREVMRCACSATCWQVAPEAWVAR